MVALEPTWPSTGPTNAGLPAAQSPMPQPRATPALTAEPAVAGTPAPAVPVPVPAGPSPADPLPAGTGPGGSKPAGPAAATEADRGWPRRGRRWRRQRPEIDPEPPTSTLTDDGRPLIVVPQTDFVACSYKNCGTLRPIDEVAAKDPCPGCGRR